MTNLSQTGAETKATLTSMTYKRVLADFKAGYPHFTESVVRAWAAENSYIIDEQEFAMARSARVRQIKSRMTLVKKQQVTANASRCADMLKRDQAELQLLQEAMRFA